MTRILMVALLSGCNWISLGVNAVTYETLGAGEAGNLVVADTLAYVALGDSGLAVLDARTGAHVATVAPPPGMESVDDVAFADGLLFLLDARAPGHVAVHESREPPAPVGVGPFSGISAAGGICIVSGGTSRLTLWRYSGSGELTIADSADLGRGQPDVLVGAAGDRAFVSTHYWGPYFGVNVLPIGASAAANGSIELEGAGFTTGGAKPARFPIDVAQLSDSIVLVAHARGVAVVDVVRFRVDRVIDVGGPAVAIAVKEDEAAVVVAGRTPALVELELTGQTERVVRRVTFARGTKPTAVAFSERNVLVAARDRGVLVVRR